MLHLFLDDFSYTIWLNLHFISTYLRDILVMLIGRDDLRLLKSIFFSNMISLIWFFNIHTIILSWPDHLDVEIGFHFYLHCLGHCLLDDHIRWLNICIR